MNELDSIFRRNKA